MEKIALSLWALCLTGMVSETTNVTDFRISRTRVLFSSYDPNAYAEEMQNKAISQVMNDIISGPLKGRHVVLVCPSDLDVCAEVVGDLLRITEMPVSVHFIPDDVPYRNESGHSYESHFVEKEEYDVVDFDSSLSTYKSSVIIMMVTSREESWWLFWNPPDHWQASAIILVTTSPSCTAQDFMVTPLLHRAPSMAMLCPYVPRHSSTTRPMFKAWTWLPYSSGQRLVDIGFWDSSRFQEWNDLFVDRFRDMSLKQINILANTIDVPYFYVNNDGTIAGMALQLVESLSKRLQYKYKIKSSPVVNVTVVDALVQSGENDMKINLAVPTIEQNKKFLISTPIDYQGFALILRVPPPIPRWKNIVYPFTWIVWLAVVLSMIFTSVTFHFLYHEHEKSIATNSLTVVQFLLSNPLASVPESWRIRCLLLPWWIGSWLIAMSYTSNLIAILTIPALPAEINTALQLAESNFRLCMLDYAEFVPEALASSTHSVLKALGDKLDMVPMQEFMPEMGEEQCATLVLAGTHAHLEGYPYVKALYVKLGIGDQIYEVKERVYPSYLSIVFHKHTPWKYKFDVETEKLLETGIIKRWYEEHMAKYEKRKESSSPLYLTPLSLHHLQGSFLLHLGGVIIGLLALTAEVVISKA